MTLGTRATELARAPSVTYGPYLGTRSNGGLVVWASVEGSERRFSGVALSPGGRPLGPARMLASAPDQLGVVAVRALGDGYGVVFTRQNGASESLEALCVDARGEASGAANVLTPLNGHALWVEAIPTATGALVFYAVRAPEKRRAEVLFASLDTKCHVAERGTVFRDVLAWQATPAPSGAFVAVVQAGETGTTGGAVSVAVLDAAGKVRASGPVSSEPGADLDLDAATVGDRLVLAWTDRRSLDPHIVSAVVDVSAQVVAKPGRLTPPQGEQTLVRLLSPGVGAKRAFIAFESLAARPSSGRSLTLSTLNADGRLTGAPIELGFSGDDGGVPEFATIGDGLSVLTLAAMCRRAGQCSGTEIAPSYVRFDAELAVVASEPLRLEPLQGAPAELGFGLGCSTAGCFAIAAQARVPAPVFATELEARSDRFQPPVHRASEVSPPLVVDHESVAQADSVAALAATSVGGQDYLAYITDFDPTTPWRKLAKPTPDGRYDPLRAQVFVGRVNASGVPLFVPLPASPISVRAHSLGGIALAPGDPKKGELLVAWAGIDAGIPQLFVTLLDKNGTKIAQRMVTHKKGELGDIALEWVDDGWVVAWVDERSGDPEVFAAKVDAKLARVGPEQRLTAVSGAASDLALAFDGKLLRLVWADSRSADVAGHADIYSALLRPRDAARDGDELRIAATRPHSFAPAIRAFRGGFAVGWIERVEDSAAGHLLLTTVGADRSPGPLTQVSAPEGEPRSFSLDCQDTDCRIVLVAEGTDSAELYGAHFDGTQAGHVSRLLSLAAGRSGVIAPKLRGDSLWFSDPSWERPRIRLAHLKW